jgi:hypothetical protein
MRVHRQNKMPRTSSTDFPSDFWHDLFSRVEHLWKCIKRNAPPASKLHQAFKRIAGLGSGSSRASAEDINAALIGFDSLPDDDRRRILNNWTETGDYGRTFAHWLGGLESATRVPYLVADRLGARVEMVPVTEIRPVSIHIEVGMTKAAALAAVDEIRGAIYARWGEMIAGRVVLA